MKTVKLGKSHETI